MLSLNFKMILPFIDSSVVVFLEQILACILIRDLHKVKDATN